MNEGALDVFYTPIYMKKQRPAIKLSVLAPVNQLDKFQKLILKYTTTKGVRYSILNRTIMSRRFIKIKLFNQVVRIKIASYNDVLRITPEFDDCKKIALKENLSLEEVMQLAQEKVQKNGKQ